MIHKGWNLPLKNDRDPDIHKKVLPVDPRMLVSLVVVNNCSKVDQVVTRFVVCCKDGSKLVVIMVVKLFLL